MTATEKQSKDIVPDSAPKLNCIYPILMFSDIPIEKRNDVAELIVTLCGKHIPNYELAAKTIKETLDTRYGKFWHCTVGEHFDFDIEYQPGSIMHCYFSAKIGVMAWRCPSANCT